MIPEVVSQVAYLIIGHDYTITMAAEAGQCEGISVKELVLEEGLLKEEELKEILKPEKMTQPMREKVMKAVS